jgi:hypothetical protein
MRKQEPVVLAACRRPIPSIAATSHRVTIAGDLRAKPLVPLTLVLSFGCVEPSSNGELDATCGDGVIQGVETCEPPEPGCSERCQLRGEKVMESQPLGDCNAVDLEMLSGSDPVVLCDDTEATIIRFDAQGKELWRDEWAEPDGGYLRSVDLDTAPAGPELVVVGQTDFSSNSFWDLLEYAWVRRFDSSGALVWQRNFRKEEADAGGVCVDSAGDVYFTYADGEDATLVKLAAENGETLWVQRWVASWYAIYDGVVACTDAGPMVANEIGTYDHDIDPDGWDLNKALIGVENKVLVGSSVEHGVSYEYAPSAGLVGDDLVEVFTWEGPEPGRTLAVAADDTGFSYVLAASPDASSPDELVVHQLDDAGEPGWTFHSQVVETSLMHRGGISTDRFGRVVFIDRPNSDSQGQARLVWVGQ